MSKVDIAVENLDELTTLLAADIKNGGFDNDSVMKVIKIWDKIATGLKGSYHKQAVAYWLMKRQPSKTDGKTSKALLRALDTYQQVLENNGTIDGDFFNRVDDAMRNFVWDYRQHLQGHSEIDFVHDLQKWQSLSDNKVMQSELTKIDQSI